MRDFSLDFPSVDVLSKHPCGSVPSKVVSLRSNNYLLDLLTFSMFVEVGHMNGLHLSLVTTVYL